MAYYDERRPGDPRDPAPVRSGGGWGAGWWIVFFVVIGFIIWAVAWSWNGDSNIAGTTTGPIGQTEQTIPLDNETAAAPEVSVDQLRQPEESGQWVNQNVRLTDVQIVARAGDQAFWVGDGPNRLLVVAGDNAMPQSDQPGQAAQNQQFQQGEELTITGTVHKVSSADELQQQFGIDSKDLSGLNAGELYLVASQINRDQGVFDNTEQ